MSVVPGAPEVDETGGVELLRRAVHYALGVICAVPPEQLSRPTPCQGWDLRMLLRHACESVAALCEGLDAGRIGLYAVPDDEAAADPTRVFCARAVRLLDNWAATGRPRLIDVADQALADSVMAGAGALEIAVHGWDVSQACGVDRPIPRDLALDLLAVASMLVPVANRHPLFAAPVQVPPTADPGQRLVAFLGRTCADRG